MTKTAIRVTAGAPGRAAVFLDRDGVLNRECGGVRREDDLELLPGVATGLIQLRRAGFLLVVVTNQSVIAREQASLADIEAVHRRLQRDLAREGAGLDAIYLCPHHPNAHSAEGRVGLACDCRKPATGMVEQARRDLGIDLGASWMVGDQTLDIEMARRAGLRSVLVRTGLGGGDDAYNAVPDHVVENLAAAAELIVGLEAPTQAERTHRDGGRF